LTALMAQKDDFNLRNHFYLFLKLYLSFGKFNFLFYSKSRRNLMTK